MPLSINCPACREPLEVEEEYRAWTVRCPRCGHEFTPDGDDGREDYGYGATPREGSADYESRPRRRRYGRPMDDDAIVERAKRALAGPASWLRVTGMLGVLAGIAGIVGAVVLGIHLADNPAQAKRDMGAKDEADAVVNTILIGVCSVFSLVFGALMAYGAVKMGRLESHGWSVATSVLAISSILFCTCCLFTGVPIGIWGLVALARPDVREGFEIAARRRGHGADPAYDADEEYE